MEFRIATPEDREAAREVADLATAILRRTYRPIPNPDAGPRPTLTRVVAEMDGRIVGTVQYGIKGSRLHIVGLMVHPEFHRRGVARAMVDFLGGIAVREAKTHLSLYTISETGNVPIFERMGFRTIREEPAEWVESDRFHTLTDVYMERIVA